MLKPSHVNVGATVALLSILLTNGYISIFLLFYPFLALLDDADHHKGTVTKSLGFQLPGAKHRGYSHSLLFNISVALTIFYGFKYFYPELQIFDLYILLAISLSHILADCVTVRGCPLLWPLSKTNFGLPIMITGQGAEKIFTFLLSGINIGLLSMVFINYILPNQYTLGAYDTKLIMIAVGTQAFITYLLLKSEIMSLKGDVATVIGGTLKIMFNLGVNGAFAYGLFYANQMFQFLDISKLAYKYGVSESLILIIFGIIVFIPSLITTFKHMDRLSFQFAGAVNILIASCLIIFFGIKLI